jgi:hypothetical protein
VPHVVDVPGHLVDTLVTSLSDVDVPALRRMLG